MFQKNRRIVLLVPSFLLAMSSIASEPVRRIDVYVLPYYRSAQSNNGRPEVAVAEKYNELLSSNKREDIVAVRDQINAQPELITPMTLMVLAIRLYDVGLRDDSVLWFYIAKDRFITLSDVLDHSPLLSQAEQATRDFATLAGPAINSYAFCDTRKQQELFTSAISWVEKHPYQAIFAPQLPAKPGDRAANLKASLEKLRAGAKEQSTYLEIPENIARLDKARKENGVEEKYCWH